ncbi:pseudomurein-binding repeat-containing protein [Methanobacterium sp.]|uniref:pseudomurein-binding repeat-containing protein n=1 Tax=Methanobacterium sp. TaxID=2164 RepID=UPI003C7411AE
MTSEKMGGNIMKRLSLLLVLLIACGALFNVNTIYAATENSQAPDNYINTNLVLNNTTDALTNVTIQNTTGSTQKNVTEPVNNTTVINQSINQNTTNSSQNNGPTLKSFSLTSVQNSTDTTGDKYKNISAIWLNAEDVTNLNITKIKNTRITDIFVKCNIYSSTYQTSLKNLVAMFKNSGIRINAWVTCFLDANGKWINPAGTTYTYTVNVTQKVAVKTPYKYWYKSWYQYRGYWYYTWKYVWKTKTTYKTVTTTQTKTGINTTYNTRVINATVNMVKNYGVNGINLDYLRYPGTAYKYTNSTQAITSFVKSVYNSVKSVNSSVAVSADVMPEGKINAYYYGQNYTQLAKYLDFLVPLVYKGGYGYNSSTGTSSSGKNGTLWIGNSIAYIVSQANGTPVVAGLQAYRSANNLTAIPLSELQNDIKAASNNGASGYALFRYGRITEAFFKNSTPNTFTLDQIQNAAVSLKSFIETNKKLPAYVTIGTTQISIEDLLNLMITNVLQLNNGNRTSITFKNISSPSNPTGDLVDGAITKTEYLSIAQNIKSFIDANGAAPNYATSSLGKIQYESVIYMYSKILNFYNTTHELPDYITVKAWTALTPVVTDPRPVYITSDNIINTVTDTNRINTIAYNLEMLGLTAVNWGLGPNSHYTVLQSSLVPTNALIVDIYGGACAGTIYEMGQDYYKALVGDRKVFSVWLAPYATDITGLAWLPRSYDDNFDPISFTGIPNPDQYLLNNGYEYIYSGDLNTIINRIYQEATEPY